MKALILTILFSCLTHGLIPKTWAQEFPTLNLSELSEKQKYFLMRDLSYFSKEYEETQHETYADLQKNDDLFQFLQSAYAADPSQGCIYGGWISEISEESFCLRPQKSKEYEKYTGKCAKGSDQLYCNPLLFGHNICVPFANKEERSQAFQSCHRIFERTGRSFEDVVLAADEAELNEFYDSIKNICRYGKQAGKKICLKLLKRINGYVDEEPSHSVLDDLKKAYREGEQESLIAAISNAVARIDFLQDRLINECGKDLIDKSEEEYQEFFNELSLAEQQNCLNLANEYEELVEYIKKILNELEQENFELYRSIMCGDNLKGTESVEEQAQNILDISSQVQCTDAEAQLSRKNCQEDLACVAKSTMMPIVSLISDVSSKKSNSCISSDNSCMVNLVTAFAKNITDLISGVWDLAGLAIKSTGGFIKEQGKRFWDWVNPIEDKTSEKQLALSAMTDQDLEEFIEDPLKWYQKLWGGIKTSFESFMKEHVGCEKWSGVPHYSKCLKPFKGWDCMSCKTYITGLCTVAGYIMPEVIQAIGTGGTASLMSSGAKSVSIITKALKGTKQFTHITKAINRTPVLKQAVNLANKTVKTSTTLFKKTGKYGVIAAKLMGQGVRYLLTSKKGARAAKALMRIKVVKNVVVITKNGTEKIIMKAKTSNTVIARAIVKSAEKSKSTYRSIERAINDPLYRLGDKMVKGSEQLAKKINKSSGVSSKLNSKTSRVAARGASAGKLPEKALTLKSMKTIKYPQSEVDKYFAGFAVKSNKKMFYGDLIHDIADKYTELTKAQRAALKLSAAERRIISHTGIEINKLKHMMYNIRQVCNPIAPIKVLPTCKLDMLKVFKEYLRQTYPRLDPKIVDKLGRADVRVL